MAPSLGKKLWRTVLVSLSRMAPARLQNEVRFPVKKMDRQCVTPVIAVTSRGSELWSAVLLFKFRADEQRVASKDPISERGGCETEGPGRPTFGFCGAFLGPNLKP